MHSSSSCFSSSHLYLVFLFLSFPSSSSPFLPNYLLLCTFFYNFSNSPFSSCLFLAELCCCPSFACFFLFFILFFLDLFLSHLLSSFLPSFLRSFRHLFSSFLSRTAPPMSRFIPVLLPFLPTRCCSAPFPCPPRCPRPPPPRLVMSALPLITTPSPPHPLTSPVHSSAPLCLRVISAASATLPFPITSCLIVFPLPHFPAPVPTTPTIQSPFGYFSYLLSPVILIPVIQFLYLCPCPRSLSFMSFILLPFLCPSPFGQPLSPTSWHLPHPPCHTCPCPRLSLGTAIVSATDNSLNLRLDCLLTQLLPLEVSRPV